jgi:branched-chain amino acid transport system permease protein
VLTKKSLVFGISGIAFLFSLPFFLGAYALLVVVLIYVSVLLASSLRVSLNAGQLNFGIPGFMAIGAYSSSLMVMKLGVPFVVAFFAAGVICVLASLIIGYPSLRLKGVYFLILTWGFIEVIRSIAVRWVSLTDGPKGILDIPPASVAGVMLSTKASQYHFALFVTLVILFVLYRLENSRFGLTLKSIRQAEELGEAVGINTYAYKVLAFAISSFFVGLTGSVYAHTLGFVTPETFTFWLATMTMIYCFVGGRWTFAGPILGAVFLTILTEPLRGLAYYERVFYGITMIVIVIFLPNGLISLPAKVSSFIGRHRRFGKSSNTTAVGGTQEI